MDEILTSSSSRKLNKSKDGIIARHRLKRNIRMPALLTTLLLLTRIQERSFVDCFCLYRTNNTDLVVRAAVLTTGVDDGMDMQS